MAIDFTLTDSQQELQKNAKAFAKEDIDIAKALYVPEAKLRSHGYDRPDEIAAYFDLAYRATDSAVVVASSGWRQPGWTALENRHVLVTDRRTLRSRVLPLTA